MDILPLPAIDAADYESFRALLKNEIPATYDGWLKDHQDRIHYWSHERAIIEIKIRPDDFTSFCLSKAKPYGMKTLVDFAHFVRDAQIA